MRMIQQQDLGHQPMQQPNRSKDCLQMLRLTSEPRAGKKRTAFQTLKRNSIRRLQGIPDTQHPANFIHKDIGVKDHEVEKQTYRPPSHCSLYFMYSIIYLLRSLDLEHVTHVFCHLDTSPIFF